MKYSYIEGAVDVDGVPVTVEVTIRQSPQKNKFWVHSIKTKMSPNSISAGTSKSSITDYKAIGDKMSVSQDSENVNNKFSIPYSTEAEYSEAVANGDMETAQRLVDEAAKKANTSSIIWRRHLFFYMVARFEKIG